MTTSSDQSQRPSISIRPYKTGSLPIQYPPLFLFLLLHLLASPSFPSNPHTGMPRGTPATAPAMRAAFIIFFFIIFI